MTPPAPGQNSGQPPGYRWEDYLSSLIAQYGSLAALSELLGAERHGIESIESIERGLRRLRSKGQSDGGVWGRRLLARFGLPDAVSRRLRWMGCYHTRFSDLPTDLCEEQLRSWDLPPIRDSAARIWICLGLCGVALRRRDFESATDHLQEARRLQARAEAGASLELSLISAYLNTKQRKEDGPDLLLAAQSLQDKSLDPEDRACWHARLIDHQAFRFNVGKNAHPATALALYQSIPEQGPVFARYRRESGIAWSYLNLGDHEAARRHAVLACCHAGDGGFIRLRAMSLNLRSRLSSPEEALIFQKRALEIAQRLGDEELRIRSLRVQQRQAMHEKTG